MAQLGHNDASFLRLLMMLLLFGIWFLSNNNNISSVEAKNAYATMMYVGTSRDYEFYIAIRVMLKSLARLKVDADLVVIASIDVHNRWVRALEEEDNAKVVRVENLDNPYKHQDNFDKRFQLSLNKLYAWSLVEYDRVVMLDADNLFLQKTDELFQCGQFCAIFINPCVFHTGLFVLQPSTAVFEDMVNELQNGRENPDGADQGFIASYFPDLLDKPMFHPTLNGSKLDGTYRLPLGYQMDASYYYLKLRWSIPCGPNSVITFPGAPWLKPWYWWSWPVLPLGLQWHEQRRKTLGPDWTSLSGLEKSGPTSCPVLNNPYNVLSSWFKSTSLLEWKIRNRPLPVWLLAIANPFNHNYSFDIIFRLNRYGAEMAVILIQSTVYLGILITTRLTRPSLSKLCYRRSDKSIGMMQNSLKLLALWSILAAYLTPFFIIPQTIHPILGWLLYLFGTFALCSIAINAFLLPMLPVLVPWFGIAGALMVMAFPWYSDGVVRALFVFGYAFCVAPILWAAMVRIMAGLQVSLEREGFMPRLGESSPPSWLNKLY
ncbi:hypothetical protein TanjilG_28118 [Lupinus angustifolius]|uniref:Glucuronosyltransferase PGSIP8 n=1 Tax=Lupinus angustifolius TaxID=3871 RepID=A0A4P1RGQ9_LUPAN|nr:hypothetical protein TanjilG_28118 [Lupinus angustifolius]